MYTVYDGVNARKVERSDWDQAKYAAKEILRRTPTRNGFVNPVSIFRNGTLVAVVSDDANSVSVHVLSDFERQYEATGYACTPFAL